MPFYKIVLFDCHRGDEFRIAFAHLRELRSVLPSTVPIVALTATATKDTFKAVVKRLSLNDPKIVALPPERPNIPHSGKFSRGV